MKKIHVSTTLLLVSAFVYAQNSITGTFSGLSNQQIELVGFKGFDNYTINSTTANAQGEFKLSYGKDNYGMAILKAEDNNSFLLVLENMDIELKGDNFANTQTIKIIKGLENKLFEQYTQEHPRREQALSAWIFLGNIYAQDMLFAVQEVPKQAILKEKQRIRTEDSLFLAHLEPQSFVSWYLPLRKLVSAVSVIAQYRTEEIPGAIAAFRDIDYADPRLYKSGLLGDVIKSHFWLIENSGRSLDSVYIEMNISIDRMLETLTKDEKKFNEVTEHLFKLLERRSLFTSSEYLALKVLNQVSCTVNNDLAAQLESYRAMTIGNVAPDFDFKKDIIAHGFEATKQPEKLSDLNSAYTVVVFGSSWCPQCPQDLLHISGLYEKWKEQSVEVVFVSLDEDADMFKRFAGMFPFISICDYGKWESPVVKSYHVFATPTFYLLNNERKIILRPHSVTQLDAWIDWYLVQGNK